MVLPQLSSRLRLNNDCEWERLLKFLFSRGLLPGQVPRDTWHLIQLERCRSLGDAGYDREYDSTTRVRLTNREYIFSLKNM